MKKVSALVLAALLSIGVFTGCSSKQADQPKVQATAQQKSDNTNKDEVKVERQYVLAKYFTQNFTPEQKNNLQNLTNKIKPSKADDKFSVSIYASDINYTKDGKLTATAFLNNFTDSPISDYSVQISLLSPDGKITIATANFNFSQQNEGTLPANASMIVSLGFQADQVFVKDYDFQKGFYINYRY